MQRRNEMSDKRSFERTSYEVRRRWDKENYKMDSIRLRYDRDAKLIQAIEDAKEQGISPTEYIRNLFENK